MRRSALRLGAAALLVLAGAASSLVAAGIGADSVPRTALSTTASTTGATTTSATTVTSPVSSALVLRGHGWGHGLGLSQWGAYGYARHGFTYDKILAHYYLGTTLGPAPVSTVRVLLSQGRRRTTLDSVVAWKVTDAAGTVVPLDPGTLTLASTLAVAGRTLRPPLTFVGKQPLVVDGKPYRGRIVVSSDGRHVEVVDVVGLEAYLKGVVPSEMPSDWPSEALKAQAVAARSYALANLAKGRDFDLYADTRSQVYGGLDAEASTTSDAVDATKGQVVLYAGKVADTLFSSTSGGRTASSLEVTGVDVPYLESVADPYDSASPVHDWGPLVLDAASVAKQLKLPGPIVDLQMTTGPSGRVQTVTVVSANDATTALTGSELRAQLELRSTWFTGALMQLLPRKRTITYGGAASLTGFVRGLDAVSLEAKTATQDWAPAGELLLDGSGAFATIVKPQAATQYRLSAPGVRIGLASIAVAARVDAVGSTAGVSGSEKPALAGAAVQLQQQNGTAWTTLAATTTDQAGAWSFAQPLASGAYRVRCAPGNGLVPGVSSTFAVQ